MGPRYLTSTKSIPSGSSVTLCDSLFFSRNGKNATFPAPSEILARSAIQAPSYQDCNERPPVYFEELGLLVKFGREPKVTVAEGQCLLALRQELPSIPVPEVYGWFKDGNFTYLFMELVRGVTLADIWASLTRPERNQICAQLGSMLKELRCLRQEPNNQFLGDISGGPLTDVVFTNGVLPRAGPFATVKEFHDWLSSMLTRGKGQHWPGVDPTDIPDPYRQYLPDDSAIVFTHCDLHPSNILISLEKPHCVASIIDWQQSGWYPDYWEFCKAEYTAEPGSQWVKEYIPQFLEEPKCVDVFELYAKAYGF